MLIGNRRDFAAVRHPGSTSLHLSGSGRRLGLGAGNTQLRTATPLLHGSRLAYRQHTASTPLSRPGLLPRLGSGFRFQPLFQAPDGRATRPTSTARTAWGPTAGRLDTLAAQGASPVPMPADADAAAASMHLLGGQPLMMSAMSSVDGDYTRGASSDSDDERRTDSSGEWPSTSGLPSQAALGHSKATYEVLRLDKHGRARHVKARRRDLCKEHRLQPRDLRRIDPNVDVAKTPPSITIKDNVLLLCLGGVRAIVTAEKALLFEPQQPASRRFLEVVLQHLHSRQQPGLPALLPTEQSHEQYMSRYYQRKGDQALTPPFELEVMESALMVATGNLDSEMTRVTQRIQTLLTKLPNNINPVNLEELRKVKGALVELEQKADTLRNMLEEVLDDEDELKELNLTHRPRREERRRQRERERLERELERAREIKEEIEERLEGDDQQQVATQSGLLSQNSSNGSSSSGSGNSSSNSSSSSNGTGSSAAGSQTNGNEDGGQHASGRSAGQNGVSILTNPGERWEGRRWDERLWKAGADGSGSGRAVGDTTASSSNGSQVGPSSSSSLSASASSSNGSSNGSHSMSGHGVTGQGQHSQAPSGPRAALTSQPDPLGHLDARTLTPWRPASTPASSVPTGQGGVTAQGPAIASVVAAAASAAVVAAVSEEHKEQARMQELRSKFDRARLAELRARFNWGDNERDRDRDARRRSASGSTDDVDFGRDFGREGWMSRLSGSEEDIQEAQEALEEMVEQEEEEQEIEEVEDLIEYYLQRASATKDEAERLLAGARDLEESIGISLSARRFEVNRLELTLSIGSFAAALGALVAGIFGMNMRSCLEMSVAGFWGVTGAIVLGCICVFAAILAYTRRKRIL